ncbi:MAG: sensor histidine kinase [Thermomicrobiales bacterium]
MDNAVDQPYFADHTTSVNDLQQFSHALLTPLAAIMGFAEVLASRDVEDEEVGEFGTIILDQSKRLAATIRAVVHLDQLAMGQPTACEPVDANALVAHIVDSYTQTVTTHPVLLDLRGAGKVAIDVRHLNLVLTELLANADRFSPAGSEIQVITRGTNDSWSLFVSDHGSGIPVKMRQQIFDRFMKVPFAPSSPRQGAGLGLALVMEIARAYGGVAWAEENRGGGARVGLRIQRTRQAPREAGNDGRVQRG